MYFKYDNNEEVFVKMTGRKGTIVKRVYTYHDNGMGVQETEKYDLAFEGTPYTTTYKVDELETAEDKDRLKDPDSVHKVLIDVQLKKGDYEFVRRLQEENSKGK